MWEQIRANRIRSVVLMTGMAVLLLVIGFFLGVIFFGSAIAGLVMAFIIWGIMTLIAYYQGDSIFLSISKARKIGREDHPRLYNIVEEMTIASGLEKTPDIYIIDDPAMNAFATGRDPKRAAVTVTSGLLQKLNRDELQGVIGHEVSHIKNRDVLLMTLCGIMLGTIVMLSWVMTRWFFLSARVSHNRRDNSGGAGAAGAALIVFGLLLMILAPIAARLIYFAISRKREYLADASSALYTRYPEGLASALEKLGASTVQLQTANQALAPMYITNPFRHKGRAATDLTSTHPPISERIRILRSMGGGASLADYNAAFSKVHGGGQVIPRTALAGVAAAGIRVSSTDTAPMEAEPDKVERTREVSDLMWKMNDYRIITCDCGTKLKIPPKLGRTSVRCPHCGRIHSV